MESTAGRAIAIVGVGAVLPDAPDAGAFWRNVREGRYSISDVPKDRWDSDLYYDPDPKAPDKSYTKIGGWVRDFEWEPLKWRLPIPPKVSDAMDLTQKWAILVVRQALADYGYPDRPLNPERTAVIFGNAMGGDTHLYSSARILFPEFAQELGSAPSFGSLPADVRAAVLEEMQQGIGRRLPPITEDTMPGELSNIVAGRIAALYDFRGPNFTTDAACASAVAAVKAAMEGLIQGDYDAVLTGGIDANMSPASYVKFCKIGALSATGSRPYAEGADGFVMGEGAVTFLMKRLADAERDGDRIYAVIRGIGASSDGRGKGITAPNPAGQKLAVRRAWQNAGLAPQPGDLVEGHGTSTAVGDVVEVQSMIEVFQDLGLPPGSVSLGSVKSNIGHLKGAAGAVGMLKAALALHEKVLPPSINYERPNPGLDWAASPFVVNTALRPWEASGDGVRRVGASAFGFGGTNFHTVLEEYVPGRLKADDRTLVQGAAIAGAGGGGSAGMAAGGNGAADMDVRAPLRGALVIGGDSDDVVRAKLERVLDEARAGRAPEPAPPREADLRAPVRLAIDFGDAEELAGKAEKALAALERDQSNRWRALRSKGVFLGRGPAAKVAFLFSGQGSQYVNMLRDLRDAEPVVADTFAEADAVMEPLLGRPLTDHIYVDGENEAAVAEAEEALKQTAITQPAVLTTETALARLLGAYGVVPDMTMGHSLGEYGALVAAGALTFPDALKAVSARGKEMTRIAFDDNGTMAAVFGPMDQVQGILDGVDGYVVVANINSTKECVIGGATTAVEAATAALQEAGYRVTRLPVSHAFHTQIVAPASGALAEVLDRLGLEPPTVPTIANISGDFYPSGPGARAEMVDILSQQVGSPVQFVNGLKRLYDAGARVFVELGPKRALTGFVTDVLGEYDDVVPLFTNHPRLDDETGVNIALCGLYAAGLGTGVADQAPTDVAPAADRAPATPGPALTAPAMPAAHATPAAQTGSNVPAPAGQPVAAPAPAWPAAPAAVPDAAGRDARGPGDRYVELGRLFAEFLDRGMAIYGGRTGAGAGPGVAATAGTAGAAVEFARIGITGAGLGLPGTERVFDERNLPRILDGGQFIVPVPHEQRRAMADHRIVRLVKGNGGQAHFETIDDPADVVKLAGRGGELDLAEEYGFPADRLEALDRVTRLAIAAGLEALRDAGMPLVQRYRTTTTGSKLPDGWALPEEMRDDTGIIFASAFPGLDSLVDIVEGYHQDEHRRQRLADLRELRARADGDESPVVKDLDVRIAELEREIEENPYVFDRRFLFRVLNMGHSQFAEYIGARGPNVGTNGACASGTQAIAMAQDWIQTGRCRRVIVISADDITTDRLMPWFGSAFLASGAAAADERVEDAAIPFDRRRHGLIIGMGGAALVVESLDSARARGIQPITEVLGTVMANSAYHGSRLNVEHIIGVMEQLVSEAEARWGIDRRAIAEQTVFVSHETYTPARGGSASAEILALRNVFGDAFDRIVIANTKGYTGHPMAVAMEDALAVKMLETGLIPPVANYREVDPELGSLNLSRGGMQPKQYSLRLGAGFGSQIAMDLMRWVPAPDGARRGTGDLGYAYRVVDPAAWNAFLQRATGSMEPQVEVAKRTLRVRAGGAALDMQALAGAGAAGTRPVAGASATVVAPAATAAAPAATPPATDPVAARVLAIVADKTGYPPDMLDLELDLEADLGIDTVKQAEMFAAVREEWGIERDDTVALRDYPTLARVIDFVREKRPDLAAAPPVAGTPAVSVQPVSATAAPAAASTGAVAAAPGAADPVATKILAIVAEKTGYPEDMLDLELDLEADLGIDTVKQAEMFAAVREEWGIERDDTVALRDYPTLARVIEFVYEKRPELAPAPGATPVADTPTAAAKPADVARGAAPAPGGPTVAATGPGAVTAPASAGAAATTAPGAADPVAARILAIVAEKTGYPEDMLELELDLEADLGIDTVKQAEMFAAVREEWGIERDDDLALRDYPTLARVIEFVYEKRPDLAPAGGVQPAGAPAAVAQPAAAMHPGAAAQPKGATPAPASGNVAPADPAADPVAAKILAIVAEKTGYPEDMLELELDLEADLGIDTVKQAEMFAAVREEWGIERDDDLALRDYPTLARVIEFVYEKRPDLAPGPGAVPVAGAQAEAVHGAATAQPAAGPEAGGPAGAAQPGGATAAALASGWAGRVPEPRLRPLLELTAPTGVELAKGDRVVVFPDHGGVGRALVARLEKRGVEALVAEDTPSAEDLVARLDAWMADGTIKGVYWLPALDTEDLAALDAAGWREALRVRAKLLYTTMRALYEQVSGVGTFLVSGTRLGGMHGYDAAGAVDPLGGAVTGFTKAFKREKPAALVKAVDFAPSRKTAALADVLIEETLRDPGVVEVGHRDGRRWTVGLAERAAHDGEALDSGAGTAAKAGSDDGTALTLGSDSVFVVTGAAGSITSAIIADLATASGGTFHLLDLTPEPDRDDGDLRRVVSDRDGLKRDIFERLKASGERATPALVEKELARLERSAAALSAIEAVESAGGTAHYYAVNLLDADAVDAVVRRIEGVSGRVDALVHAAGLEISRLLPDKEPKEFDLVFDVKADGLFHLLSALGEVPLGAVVVFSSIAGRFGNAGQADYSAANDLMCKVVSSFRTSRPDTRGIAIDWTAWADIGMAARGSIPAIMKQAGIDMLPPAIGVPVVRQELTHGTKGEVVIAGSLGVMVQEFDDAGGLDRGHVQALVAAHGPMVGAVKAMGIHSGLVVETELDPATQPFLHDHQIGGTPVLPGVMGIEAMAEAAGLLFPDLRVAAVENVEFHAPFKFYRSEPRTVTVQASFRQDGDDVVADCRLLGSRMLHGRSEPDVTTHFTAQVRLRPRNESTNGDEATAVTVPAAPLAEDGTVSADDIYRLYFHGPAYQVLDQAWQVNDVVVGRLAGALPPNHVPPERPTLAGPRLVELCFQTAGLRELAADARMGLPYHIDRLELLRGPEAEGDGLVALARTADEGAFDVDLADGDGNLCLSLRGYRTMALPDAVDEEALAPLRRLMDSADG